jgi:hypothetical protein
MVIRNREGHECGRILGRNNLKTMDESLKQIWNERIVPVLPGHDNSHWENAVIDALAIHGYFGERVE